MAEGEIVELRGVLTSISKRFWNEGWGYGTITPQGGPEMRITGKLKGLHVGDTLLVRGKRELSKFGVQVACEVVVASELSALPQTIKKFLRSGTVDTDVCDLIYEAVCALPEGQRWRHLADHQWLLSTGATQPFAFNCSSAAAFRMEDVNTRSGLVARGASEQEATKLMSTYGKGVFEMLDSDPYAAVRDKVLSFRVADRLDAEKTPPRDSRRLEAACLQALQLAERNGHTGLPRAELAHSAAIIAGVYSAHVDTELEHWGSQFNDLFQCREAEAAEALIARWVRRVVEEDGL